MVGVHQPILHISCGIGEFVIPLNLQVLEDRWKVTFKCGEVIVARPLLATLVGTPGWNLSLREGWDRTHMTPCKIGTLVHTWRIVPLSEWLVSPLTRDIPCINAPNCLQMGGTNYLQTVAGSLGTVRIGSLGTVGFGSLGTVLCV